MGIFEALELLLKEKVKNIKTTNKQKLQIVHLNIIPVFIFTPTYIITTETIRLYNSYKYHSI